MLPKENKPSSLELQTGRMPAKAMRGDAAQFQSDTVLALLVQWQWQARAQQREYLIHAYMRGRADGARCREESDDCLFNSRLMGFLPANDCLLLEIPCVWPIRCGPRSIDTGAGKRGDGKLPQPCARVALGALIAMHDIIIAAK